MKLTTAGSSAMVLLFLTGCVAIVYARWTQPIDEGDRATDRGDFVRALSAYGVAEKRFDSAPPLKRLLAPEYNRVIANELWVLHRLERYDDVIEKAARAPEGANPHFWAGAACFKLGRVEKEQAARTAWLVRAQEELRRAVDAVPADFDARFDLELAMRLNQELRRRPQTPPSELMHLLRPEPRPGAAPTRRAG
jgi:hypothetical protein